MPEQNNEKLRVGILSTGLMAASMAEAISTMKNEVVTAVASRSPEKAEAFAKKYGIPKACGSYEELANAPDVDLIYIASPHALHEANSRLCIAAGKPVLVEKSFTANASQAASLLSYAKEKKVFLAEAIWPRYMPLAKTLKEIIASGRLGEIVSATGNLGYAVSDKPRMLDPELAGGALLDVGIYPLTFFSVLFGEEVSEIKADARLSENGLDLENRVLLRFVTENGEVPCVLYSSMTGASERRGMVYGTKGYMEVGNVNNYEYIEIHGNQRELIERIDCPVQDETGYVYQFEACRRDLAAGRLEPEEMPHEKILKIMTILDRIRAEMGVRYPFE